MATSSIFNNVNIKDKKVVAALVSVLEQAETKHGKKVVLSKVYTEPGTDQINNLFGENE